MPLRIHLVQLERECTGLMLLNQVRFARRAASRPGVLQREVRVALGWEVWPWQSPHLTTWEGEGGRGGREDEGCHPRAAGWRALFLSPPLHRPFCGQRHAGGRPHTAEAMPAPLSPRGGWACDGSCFSFWGVLGGGQPRCSLSPFSSPLSLKSPSGLRSEILLPLSPEVAPVSDCAAPGLVPFNLLLAFQGLVPREVGF